jgi:methyl-accepting chemotaxis protein
LEKKNFMARKSGNSLLNSLRGIIWISTTVLAFFICTFGLISYLIVTLLTNDVFYSIFIPFLFLAFSVIVFGWWLSNELVGPIEKVTLLAKSLERNSSTSLPKTSGSSETDQLLQILHRNSQQMQTVVTLMDKVANGNVDVTLTPLKGSDRLSASFQRLLSKVSESIHAREELTKLENEIEQIKTEIAPVRGGNLDAEIRSDYFKTKEITETIKYLLENLGLMISLVKVDSVDVADSAADVEKTLRQMVKSSEQNIQEISQASVVLKQVPGLVEKISDELFSSARSAEQTIEKTRYGTQISQKNSEAVGQLRSKLREAVNRIQSLNERSQEIAKVAKLVDDLANRTNMTALNASIQATELGEDGRGFVLVSEELERLAARANGTNKQLALLNNSILTEIGKVESSLKLTMTEVADLSKYAIETNNVLGELERYVSHFLNLQENLIALSRDQSEETDEAFETFALSVSETEETVRNMKESADRTQTISRLMKNLQMHTADFRVATNPHPDAGSRTPPDETAASPTAPVDAEEAASEEFSTADFNAVKLTTEEFRDMTDAGHDSESEADEEIRETAEPEDPASAEFASENFDAKEFDLSESDAKEFDYNEFISNEFTSEELKFMAQASQETFSEELDADDFFGEQDETLLKFEAESLSETAPEILETSTEPETEDDPVSPQNDAQEIKSNVPA